MTMTELISLGEVPILLNDQMGIVICWDVSNEEIGVQVPGEEDIRWLPVSVVEDQGMGHWQ